MFEFLAKHSYLVLWILSLIIIGSVAILIVQLNGVVPAVTTLSHSIQGVLSPTIQTPPAPPSVTLTIQKSKTGNTLVVQWQNLPNSTVALDIFRSTANTDNWLLWKTVTITSDELTNGTAQINLGTDTEAGYSFQIEAVSGNGGGPDSPEASSTPLWTSSSTIPTVATSTPPSSGTPPENPPVENPTSTTETTSSTSSSTDQNPPPTSNPSSTNSSSTSGNNPPPGNPYYNPQVQITGYGTAPGSFWVQRVNNQSIEIGWQNIPTNADSLTVARAASSTGPWSTIIIQHDPGTTGSYSLQLIDNSLDDPYYYEMTAFEGTTTITTYGPVYLEGAGD